MIAPRAWVTCDDHVVAILAGRSDTIMRLFQIDLDNQRILTPVLFLCSLQMLARTARQFATRGTVMAAPFSTTAVTKV